MDSEIVGAVTEWETVPVGGGYNGLHELADSEFSGAVNAGSTWGFMLNGRLIGIPEGSLTAFEASEPTAYEAPDPSLPLLFTMQAQGGEKQTEYYTQEKPLSEADSTLSDGNFTGYIELSENVHSGDYYVVYYGGKSMSVAFVGNNQTLLTEDEAFDRACDEIGIYGVFATDITGIDIPEVADSPTDSDEKAATESAASTDTETNGSTRASDSTTDTDAVEIAPAEPDADATTEETTTEASAADRDSSTAGSTPTADDSSPIQSAEETGSSSETVDSTKSPSGKADSTNSPTEATRDRAEKTSTPSSVGSSTSSGATAGVTQQSKAEDSSPFSAEAEWRNTTTIPSLDPSDDEAETQGQQRQQPQQSTQSGSERRLSREQLTKRLQQAEEVMEKAEAKHNELIEQRDAAAAERDEAQQRVETLETKLAEAEAEIEALEAKLDAAQSQAERAETTTQDTDGAAGPTLEPAAALSGTNLFVRYDSKGEGTLKTAHAGNATREEVNENLRIEHHTTFETEGLTVDGEPFETFLDDQIEVRFTNWLVRDLLYEIQATGTQSGMHGIFDAIPKIDRIELHGTVELGTDEDDEPIKRAFDLIVRNKHGSPLFVANFDESKEPVGAEMIEDLILAGNELRQREEDFGAAFAVTTSYFSPDALEATEDATGGGLLSRSRGKSFVTLSRKTGFHLCLVDRIDDGFDLREPEI